ncbi:MAG: preprotein translocase subunit YajC [Dethiobacter sp.]|nr:preprotein translocase subunit YajC [Dethiobacter sp.]
MDPAIQSLLPFIVLFVVFYFLLIRPQMNQQKQRKDLLTSLKEGDKVRTVCGIYGRVENVNGDELAVRIAEKTTIQMARFGVESIIKEKD